MAHTFASTLPCAPRPFFVPSVRCAARSHPPGCQQAATGLAVDLCGCSWHLCLISRQFIRLVFSLFGMVEFAAQFQDTLRVGPLHLLCLPRFCAIKSIRMRTRPLHYTHAPSPHHPPPPPSQSLNRELQTITGQCTAPTPSW